MRCSIELIPRSRSGLLAEARLLRAQFPALNTINIPDLKRFSLRSWQAAALTRASVSERIPHLRAADLVGQDPGWLSAALDAAGVQEVVLIAGDPPAGASTPAVTPLRLMEQLRMRKPSLGIYAALDPHAYRQDAALARNLRDKLSAGATGFFSQPLFALPEFERCMALLPAAPVFWGLSPVLSDRSRAYWASVNQVRFPTHFRPDLSWNLSFAHCLLDRVQAVGHHLYLMPIRVDLETYLAPLYDRLSTAIRGEDCTLPYAGQA